MENIKKNLINLWPSIYRAINTFLYFVFSVIKSMISLAVKQIKN